MMNKPGKICATFWSGAIKLFVALKKRVSSKRIAPRRSEVNPSAKGNPSTCFCLELLCSVFESIRGACILSKISALRENNISKLAGAK